MGKCRRHILLVLADLYRFFPSFWGVGGKHCESKKTNMKILIFCHKEDKKKLGLESLLGLLDCTQ